MPIAVARGVVPSEWRDRPRPQTGLSELSDRDDLAPVSFGTTRVPALAGIRGIAILLVLGFHLGVPFVTHGGPVGVTLFFVLSGFLITSLLAGEWSKEGSIDLRRFYVRRARRLMPALVVAVVAVFVVAAVVGQARAVAHDSLLALTYMANWARAEGDLMGMWNHAWSLAIEEQFYLLWPVLFIALHQRGRWTRERIVAVLIGLAVLSALVRAGLTMAGWTDARVYFGSDTRAEALLAGCALALTVAHRAPARIPACAAPLALLALALLVSVPEPVEPWPGATYTLVTIAACALILAALRPDAGQAGLTWTPLVWIGERSYSLYLWHVPVILFLSDPLADVPALPRVILMGSVSIVAAAVSYTYVEQPFRRRTSASDSRASAPSRLAVDHSG